MGASSTWPHRACGRRPGRRRRPLARAPTLTSAGPFDVATGSRGPLTLTLAHALIAIAGLASPLFSFVTATYAGRVFVIGG